MQIDLSLVIPLYNEARRLPRLGEELLAFAAQCGALGCEVILADDGSNDGSGPALADLAAEISARGLAARVVSLSPNQGKGAALRAGVAKSTGRWVLTLDADMATPARQVLDWQRRGLINMHQLPHGRPRAYLGSREHPDAQRSDHWHRHIMGRVFNLLFQLMTGLGVEDSQCGFKLYPGDLARSCFARMKCDGWAHDVELLLLLQNQGCELEELPVAWQAIAGSKVSPLLDSLRMLMQLLGISAGQGVRRWLGLAAGQDAAGRLYYRLSLAVFLAALAVTLATFSDYGVAWDAWRQKVYGQKVLAYWLSLGGDTSALGFFNLHLYGGLFEGLAAAVGRISPWGEMETRHLLSALCGIFGALGAWRLAALLGGPRAGFWAALLLLLLPSYYGHMFINSKDIPFAAGYIWSLYYLVQAARSFPRTPRGVTLKLGIAWGCTLGIRVGALVLGFYLLAAALSWLIWRVKELRSLKRLAADAWNLTAHLLPAVVIAWLIMLLAWPWAQHHPLTGPFTALGEISAFDWPGKVLLAGREVSAGNLPWHYLPLYLAVKIPPGLMAALALMPAVGAALLGLGAGKGKRGLVLLILLAALFPVLYVIARGSVLYDGIRHLLFILPVLCVLAGLTVSVLASWAGALHQRAGAAVSILAGLTLLPCLWSLASLHPHQYIYYNPLAGGPAGAQGRYELDYWGTSYADATRWLAAHLRTEFGAELAQRRFKVYTCGHSFSSNYFFPPFMQHTKDVKQADFFLGYTRGQCHDVVRGQVMHTVRREGAVLCLVKDLRPEHEAWQRFKELLAKEGIFDLYALDWRLASPNHLDWSGGFAVSRAFGGSRTAVNRRVDAGSRAAWLSWQDNSELPRRLEALGLKFSSRRKDGLMLRYDFSPPPGLRLLSAGAMSARANLGQGGEHMALDRDWATAWSTGQAQAPGQRFLLDLGQAEPGVCRLRLFTRSEYDNPAHLLVETSTDGVKFQAAGQVHGLGGALFWDGVKVNGGATGAPLEVGFSPRTARYIRLRQEGRNQGTHWHIRELAVLAAQGPPPRLDAAKAAKAVARLAGPKQTVLAPPWLAAVLGIKKGRFPRGSGELNEDGGVVACLPAYAGQVANMLQKAGWDYQRLRAGGFEIFKIRSASPEQGLSPLPVHMLRAESSLSPAQLPMLFDGDEYSRWDSGAPQKAGMSLTLSFAKSPQVAGLMMLTRLSPADFPRGLKLQSRVGGQPWQTIDFKWRPRPPFYFNGSMLLLSGRGHELLTFKPIQADELRLTLSSNHDRYFWSVHELWVLSPHQTD